VLTSVVLTLARYLFRNASHEERLLAYLFFEYDPVARAVVDVDRTVVVSVDFVLLRIHGLVSQSRLLFQQLQFLGQSHRCSASEMTYKLYSFIHSQMKIKKNVAYMSLSVGRKLRFAVANLSSTVRLPVETRSNSKVIQ